MSPPLLLLLLACQTEPAATPPPASSEPPPEAAAPSAEAEPPSAFEDASEGAEHAVDDAERAVARHVLISYVGAKGKPLGINRSREEAQALAESVLARAQAGEDLAALAKELSDDGSARRGGFVGSAGHGAWVKPFEDAVWALEAGELSGVVETDFGFHVIRREALQEVHVRHVVVQHAGVRNLRKDDPSAARSPEAARARAEEALAAIEAGEPFEEVAKRFSDGPMGKRGGDLGWFVRGDLGPAFDEAVFALEVGEHTGVVESPFGMHVIERVD
ncbi:MAG: peptidylprolyl isomerase [Alphaproteobacteria bacterium]|nr:peptidylprolyl isomerase [Alphaproteobacteria bacterium]